MAEYKPLHHRVPVVRINEVLPHPNADRLEIIPIDQYQAISVKGQFKVGDLACYIYPDSIVPEHPEFSFVWEKDGSGQPRNLVPGIPVPEKYRRIAAKKLRKEWSEGLLMPVTSFSGGLLHKPEMAYGWLQEGQDVSDLLGVTHYNPPEPQQFGGESESGPRNRPRTFRGWVRFLWWKFIGSLGFDTPLKGFVEAGPKTGKPYYDIENFKNHKSVFEPGEPVVVTEKLHGCQGKYVYQDGKMYVGSRNRWLASKSTTIWRKCLEQNPWIEQWCRGNEGYTLYGEVIPCQGEKFMYGYNRGQVGFKVFDILTPEHIWMTELFWEDGRSTLSGGLDKHRVPVLYKGPYKEETIRQLVDGKSTLGVGIREGIVIKPAAERHVRGLGRVVLKLISNTYLERS